LYPKNITLVNDYLRLLIIHIPLGAIIGLSIVLIHEIYHVLTELYHNYTHDYGFLLIVFPLIALMLSYLLVTSITKLKTTGGGSHRLLEVYHYEGGKMTLERTIIEPLASAITIGLGGSAGFEGPSLLLGGGLGSYLGQKLKLATDELSTILICGAAAGVAAIFKAPLTGIMFALELPYQRDLYREAFIPATLTSASSYIVAITFMGGERIFPILPSVELTSMLSIHSIIIGVIAGVVSVLFVNFNERVHNIRENINLNGFIIALLGGLSIGLIAYYFPQISGTGYETLSEIINGEINQPIIWIATLLILKIFATTLTLNMGGSGGIFVPTLFVGATLGLLYTDIIPNSGGAFIIVAAMAAMISASNKTLLTSVALVAETTGPASVAYTLLASVTSYFISGKISFYGHVQPEKELLEEEEALHSIYHTIEHKYPNLIEKVKISELVRKDSSTLPTTINPKDALFAVSENPYSVYPVVNDDILIGSITLEDILFNIENNSSIIDGINTEPLIASVDDNLKNLIESLSEGEYDCIFVVEDLKSMKFAGFISETDIRIKLMEQLKEIILKQ